MAHWLVKSERDTYSFADLEREGKTVWDGVRNNAAALNLKAMKLGEEVFFYHSQKDPGVVGVAKVVREAFPDVSDPSGRFVAVELAPVRALKTPVPLAALKAEAKLADLVILRQGRLSVSPVKDGEWATILQLAGG